MDAKQIDMKLEVIVLPVTDVERSVQFYRRLGWRFDLDVGEGAGRRVHVTPPGSSCSIIFGAGISPSPPGSTQLVHLVVNDIEAAHAELVRRGVDVSGVFHDAAGGYEHFAAKDRAGGPDPGRRSYASFATFRDPDGNGFVLQEVTSRFPGRIDSNVTSFASASDLADAMRRAASAHGEHEKRVGAADPNWPDWYAAYMAAEQSGREPPR